MTFFKYKHKEIASVSECSPYMVLCLFHFIQFRVKLRVNIILFAFMCMELIYLEGINWAHSGFENNEPFLTIQSRENISVESH